ncbi:tRNA (guanosine(37)-N1)-methyltransferase TrmD [Ectothiorhodospiraceae bacterium WFHF3C12]|nr:tRNA (guanosine(37)-N1)-methyltransferase TrmD [Ectothiorhodospiraceae bacterium WFHF3C12]
MRFDVVTLFPELVADVVGYGVTRRAHEAGLVELETWNPRDYTHDRHQSVDDRPYGGGPGMVMKVQPVREAIQAARSAHRTPASVVYLSPQGRKLDQDGVEALAGRERLILLCGRYEGVDERLLNLEVDEEWSIGDYVLSGGELPAMILVDAITRLIPGALGHAQSAACDSFAAGLLDCPHYTRPEEYEGLSVPEVLLGGNHQAVEHWRLKQALGRTWLRRPDLLEGRRLDELQRRLLDEFIREHRGEPEA